MSLPFRVWRLAVVCALTVMAAACASAGNTVPPGTVEPDRFLYERGTASLKEEKWLDAREYFRQIVDGYPQSAFRPDAKLGLGDTYIGEDSAESLVLGANEFREFLKFFPTNPRADYAQYRLAMSHHAQMRAPERDQTETRAAVKEFDVFIERYPMSQLMTEVRQRRREARDRLSEASYRVGLHYFRVRWYPGAIDRFREVLRDDSEFTGRDRVYFYLAESLARSAKPAEAIPYFERLLTEFPVSELREDTQERLQALKMQ